MALLPAVIVPAALLEDGDLLALRLGNDLRSDDEAGDRLQVRAFPGEEDVGDVDAVAGFTSELLDDDLVSGGDAILLTARAHDCEHCFNLFRKKLDARP